MDKLEIIAIANKIHTYDISIQPFEDCCTIFTPKNPVTKPTLRKAEKMEARFDYGSLLKEAVEKTEFIDIYPESKKNSDLF